MKMKELRKLLKTNEVPFYTYWGKQKLIELATINNLLPKEEAAEENPKFVNYERLKTIRQTPTKVILKDEETEEEHTFPSIYKAAQFIDKSPQTIRHWVKKMAFGIKNIRYSWNKFHYVKLKT